MVNTGHPSRACKLCRARRIRCDETKPFCLKCKFNMQSSQRLIAKDKSNVCAGIKSKRVCPGYRDPFEINLRDETQATIRKAKAAQKRKMSADERAEAEALSARNSPGRASSSHSDGSSSSRASPSAGFTVQDISNPDSWGLDFESPFDGTTLTYYSSEGSELRLPRNLQTPLDQQATCYFLSQYVLRPVQAPGPPGRGILTFLISLLNSPNAKETPLPMAFAATSLAALAVRPNSKSLLAQASLYYSRALKEVNTALQSKELALKDTSVASVIMLSFYEGLVASEDPFTGWSNHLNGAKALIRLRSPDRITATSESTEMFEFVRSSMVRQSMFGFLASPSAEEVKWWGDHCVMDRVGHAALLLNMRTTLVRADADKLLVTGPRTSQKIEQVLDLLQRAKDIMAELSRWIENVNPYFEKTVAGWVDDVPEEDVHKATAFPGRMFSFPNVWVAAKHLNTDASRVMLSVIIVRCIAWICAPSDHTKTAEYLEAAQVGREAVNNVVASVPYFLAWTGDAVTTPLFPCGTPDSPKGFAGVSCLWPLFATGLSPFATRSQKKYIYGRLNWISESMGIKPAGAFAKFILKHVIYRTVDLGVFEEPNDYSARFN